MSLIDQSKCNLMLMHLHKNILKLKLAIAKQDKESNEISDGLRTLFATQEEQLSQMQLTEVSHDNPSLKEEETNTD